MNKNALHNKPLTGKKGMAWTNNIKLSPITEACKKQKMTFNDYLTAIIIKTLNEYTQSDLGQLICYIPFSLRGQPKDGSYLPLENDFSALMVKLPIGKSKNLFKECSNLFNSLKTSLLPYTLVIGMRIMGGILPPSLSRKIMYFFANKATLLFSNVPGPRGAIYYKGKALKEMVSMSPSIGNCGLAITSFSYNEHFIVTCYADSAVMENPCNFISILENNLKNII